MLEDCLSAKDFDVCKVTCAETGPAVNCFRASFRSPIADFTSAIYQGFEIFQRQWCFFEEFYLQFQAAKWQTTRPRRVQITDLRFLRRRLFADNVLTVDTVRVIVVLLTNNFTTRAVSNEQHHKPIVSKTIKIRCNKSLHLSLYTNWSRKTVNWKITDT